MKILGMMCVQLAVGDIFLENILDKGHIAFGITAIGLLYIKL